MLPDTRPPAAAGSLTVNTTLASGTGTRPDAAAWSTYRRACRGEHPNRPASTRAASAAGTPALSQLRGRVDPLSMLAAASAATPAMP